MQPLPESHHHPLLRRLVRGLAAAVVVTVLAVAVLVAAGYRSGAERHWLLALLQYLPYPLHLAPAALALTAGLLLGRGWVLAGLVSAGVVVGPVMGLELPQREAEQGRTRLRVLTYNIKASDAASRVGGFAWLAREIDRHDADLIVLQDAGEPSARHQAEPVSVAALLGTRQQVMLGQYVVASRYPLLGCESAALPAGVPGEAWMRCRILIDEQEIDLYAVHLQTPRAGLDAARRHALEGVETWQANVRDRLAQAEALSRDVAARHRPVILAGDFNAPDTSVVMQRLYATGLRDAFAVAGFGYGHTYGHVLGPGLPFLRIDHVLASPEIGIARADVGGLEASPHRPVVADLLLPAHPTRSAAPGRNASP